MQISDILNQLSQQPATTGGAASASNVTEGYADGNRTLSGLKAGEVFEGTVLDVENGKVTISLANGSNISARLDAGVSLTQGLATFFQVKSNEGGQIALKAVTQNNFSNPTLLKALTQAGAQVTTRNLDLVKEMMAQQLPIDSKNVLSMVRAANSFPSAGVSTLAQLQKLSLPINELNIEQLEHYNRGEGQLQKSLDPIIKALPELIRQAPGQAEGVSMAKQILSLFTEGAGQPNASEAGVTGQPVGEAGNLPAGENVQTAGLSAGAADVAESVSAGVTAPGSGVSAGAIVPGSGVLADTAIQADSLPAEVAGQTESMPVGTHGEIDNLSAEAADRTGNLSVETAGHMENLPEGATDQAGNLSERVAGETNIVMSGETKTAFAGENGQQAAENMDSLKQLQSILEQIDEGQFSKEKLSELFGKRSFQEALQNVANKQWFISPEEVKDKQKLEDLFQRIDRQMSRLQEIFSQAGQKDNPVTRQIADTRSNINFLNQINQYYNYVQIPLRMTNQNATGDLYVYTNRKSIGKRDGELSAHLHLEMEHLGTTDVFVKLNNKKLSTNFIMEDEKSLDLVMEHIDILTDRLQKKGYEVAVQIKENPDTEQKAMFIQEIMGQQQAQPVAVSRYSFDVKV